MAFPPNPNVVHGEITCGNFCSSKAHFDAALSDPGRSIDVLYASHIAGNLLIFIFVLVLLPLVLLLFLFAYMRAPHTYIHTAAFIKRWLNTHLSFMALLCFTSFYIAAYLSGAGAWLFLASMASLIGKLSFDS